jgi:large subunit ribosomal protein L29
MKLDKIRNMSEAELAAEAGKLKKELFNLRFQQVTGQLENPIKMRDVKKQIARVKTVLREKELKRAEG